MDDRQQADHGLVEEQGVNAGPAIDEEPGPAPAGADREGPEPPDEPGAGTALSEEMAGLPEQRPGYPGQQNSVDTG
ncbi:hypothetical protein SAMN04489712_104316 [Thermomonospora echinospora]|uniref:Uncharacterized protein n=1 Tax=Thermomonospora echinospora TaxID=1992 RepID=A0A1H5Z1Y1_9ACTN|nr:hypothetical protein [Thermomonospora echinospora]SEG30609.1 hypothetical protein SAMN04489712_104316 [Thermomonospora echinospora]